MRDGSTTLPYWACDLDPMSTEWCLVTVWTELQEALYRSVGIRLKKARVCLIPG